MANSRSALLASALLALALGGTTTAALPAGARDAAPSPAAARPADTCPIPVALQTRPAWSNPVVAEVATPFGERRHPVLGFVKEHTGVDLAVTGERPRVHAAGPGTVSEVGKDVVVIDHGAGVETRYEHVDPLRLTRYGKIDAGEPIGTVAPDPATGERLLHLEVRQDGVPVDPVAFLETKEVALGETPVTKVVEEPLPKGEEPPPEQEPEPETETAQTGSGSGIVLGELGEITGVAGGPVSGTITTSVANIPNRTSDSGFASSMGTLSSAGSDFILLNEISRHSNDNMRALAPGYDVYRDPVPDRTQGGAGQSMNNAVMWNTDRWSLLDGGRVKVVDDDRGFHSGRAFVWDRYATWALLQRTDGAVVGVVSSHMPTNPGKFPRQHGSPGMSRVEQYARGMDITLSLVRALSAYGPVLYGGDMNSHHSQGSWTAAAKMTAAGYDYAKDQGVMYIFYPPGTTLGSHRQVGVASDHPAIITTINMNGQAPQPDTDAGPEEGAAAGPLVMPQALLPSRLELPQGDRISGDQIENAAEIIARGREAGLPPDAWVVAVAAALADSGLTNLEQGDRLGVFRQRPDAGTGDAESIQDPEHAADAFYGVAEGVRNPGLTDIAWSTMTVGEAAATVQRSPFPDLYDEREADARYVVEQLTGVAFPGSDSCGRPAVGYCPPTPWTDLERELSAATTEVLRCLQEAFPEVTSYAGRGDSCEGRHGLDVLVADGRRPMAKGVQATGDAVAAFLTDHAEQLDVGYVIWAGETWSPDQADAGWRPYQPRTGPTDDPSLMHFDRVHVALSESAC
ncbi:hypothetical protein HNR19_003664 [Nocardioides thalensis]|uniref:M23 family metallopeptidase n=1 Tax=Nocardioides thalensis TaxID=1914755 RepID=A0A853C7I2_9ACTN|nr:peptidoglycan DD-metalloendopeptidase family protein [Nocardioides thalensis]NYJ02966.1 hypothetical protein [Nocardioides thalensis]